MVWKSLPDNLRDPNVITDNFKRLLKCCSGNRGNVFTVGTYSNVAVCRRGRLGGARGEAPTEGGEERGGGILWRLLAQLVSSSCGMGSTESSSSGVLDTAAAGKWSSYILSPPVGL